MYIHIHIYTHDRCLFFSEKENRGKRNKFAITIFSRRLSKPDNNSSDRYRFDQQFPRHREKKIDARTHLGGGVQSEGALVPAKQPASNQKACRLSAGQRVFSLHSVGEARFAAAKSTRVAVVVRCASSVAAVTRNHATMAEEALATRHIRNVPSPSLILPMSRLFFSLSLHIPSTFLPCSLLFSRT